MITITGDEIVSINGQGFSTEEAFLYWTEELGYPAATLTLDIVADIYDSVFGYFNQDDERNQQILNESE